MREAEQTESNERLNTKRTIPRRESLAKIGMLFVWMAIVLSQLGRFFWLFDLFSHFYWHLWVLSIAIATMLYGCSRRYFRFSVATLTALSLVLGWLYLPRFQSPLKQPGLPLRIVSCNVLSSNSERSAVVRFLKQSKADVILLMEVTPDWGDVLEALEADYPFHQAELRSDNFGIALFSKVKPESISFVTFDRSQVPSLSAIFRTENQSWRIIGTHPLPPIGSSNSYHRNNHFESLASFVQQGKMTTIVVGDLNCTSWSPHFQYLLNASGLADSRRGFGIQGTWPTSPWLLRIPIDHALVSSEIRVLDRSVGPDIGSDHRPIVVDLELPNP